MVSWNSKKIYFPYKSETLFPIFKYITYNSERNMENFKLGNLEEIILLLVGVLYGNAYSVSIVEEYKKQTDKNINISAIHTVLYRLEKKGLLDSRFGDSQSSRGGKRKRLFYITAFGSKVMEELRLFREQLRTQIPEIALTPL